MDRKRIILYALIAVLLPATVAFALLFLVDRDDGVVTVGICMSDMQAEAAYARQLEEAFVKLGYTVQMADAKNDQSLQNSQIDTFIKEKCDALIVSMVMTSTAEELTQRAKEADIPTVLVCSEPENAATAGWEQICFVGCDPNEPGAMQGRLAAALPNKGDVNDDGTVSYILLQDDTDRISTGLRTDGALKGMRESGLAITELACVTANGDREEAKTQTAKCLAQMGKDIEVVLCNNDEMALGALEAIADGGRTVGTDIYVIGINGVAEAVEKVQTGALTATVMDDRAAQAVKVAEVIGMLLNDEAVEKRYYIPHVAITAENAGQYAQ